LLRTREGPKADHRRIPSPNWYRKLKESAARVQSGRQQSPAVIFDDRPAN
jgi:hypothetical protein